MNLVASLSLLLGLKKPLRIDPKKVTEEAQEQPRTPRPPGNRTPIERHFSFSMDRTQMEGARQPYGDIRIHDE